LAPLAVEKDRTMSSDPLPENEPKRASPSAARRATRFSCRGDRGASVPIKMMMEPWSGECSPPLSSGRQIGCLPDGAMLPIWVSSLRL
jgi:hypothetical protein